MQKKTKFNGYVFFCKKCGEHVVCPNKEEYKIAKKSHQQNGCHLMSLKIPKGGRFLVREEIALEYNKAMENLNREAQRYFEQLRQEKELPSIEKDRILLPDEGQCSEQDYPST
jgi:hypothetical protein